MRNSQINVDPNTLGVTEVYDDEGATVTTGNFEGPQLLIESMEFGDQVVDLQKHPGVLDYSVTSFLFDPDHDKLGLPDLNVRVSPVRLYKPDEGGLSGVLDNIRDLLPGKSDNDKPEPYRVFTKDIELTNGRTHKIAMQLWLTEFKVTIGVKPDVLKNGEVKAVQKALDEKLSKPPSISRKLQLRRDTINREMDSLRDIIAPFEASKQLAESRLENQRKIEQKLNREIDKNQKRLIRRSTSKRRAKAAELKEQQDILNAKIDSLNNQIAANNDSNPQV